MLVLARKTQEAVVISGSSGFEQLLKVTVLEIRGGSVKLGFEACDDVPIHRAEVWSRIRAEIPTPDRKRAAQRLKERVPCID